MVVLPQAQELLNLYLIGHFDRGAFPRRWPIIDHFRQALHDWKRPAGEVKVSLDALVELLLPLVEQDPLALAFGFDCLLSTVCWLYWIAIAFIGDVNRCFRIVLADHFFLLFIHFPWVDFESPLLSRLSFKVCIVCNWIVAFETLRNVFDELAASIFLHLFHSNKLFNSNTIYLQY